MRCCGWWIGALALMITSTVSAQTLFYSPTTQPSDDVQTSVPQLMVLPAQPPSVYAPVEPEREDEGINKGGVDVDLNFRYLTDDVYRGISHDRAVYIPGTTGVPAQGKLHGANFQVDSKLSFNFGKLPHPFVGVFTNVDDSDPLSRFQEIRPTAGFDYTIRPLVFNVGINSYIYPERERQTPNPNTSEVYCRFTLDDSYFFLTPNAILSPYIYGAYDYDRNNGWYLETGVKHDFEFPDFGVIVSPYADVAYVSHFAQQFTTLSKHSSGFQHYDVGLVASLSLNHLLKLHPRYGQFAVEGYLTYTSKFSNAIFANTEVWGGVGLKYRY